MDAQRLISIHQTTPYLFLDLGRVSASCMDFVNVFSAQHTFYAVKANDQTELLELLFQSGIGFEVSSVRELAMLRGIGVPGDRIISGNPIKTIDFIKMAAECGVKYLVVDSQTEVDKIGEVAPGVEVVVRVAVSNEGSEWPLIEKFGTAPEEVVPILLYARRQGLVPHGIMFHVGSQSTRLESWFEALETVHHIWAYAKEQGLDLATLNVGGGFPIRYLKPIPDRASMLTEVYEHARGLFPEAIAIDTEPGRAVVGEAGTIVSSVIAVAHRGAKEWLYLDVGVFNGLMESIGGIRYRMSGLREGPLRPYTVAGPSCDSFDVVASDVELPPLEIGDKVLIHSAGAYTTVYASGFNGCTIPPVLVKP